MPDNINVLSSTDPSARPVATDQIGGVDFQRIKLIFGADGVNSGDVSSSNPLPVTLPSATVTALTPPTTVAITAASLPLPTSASTETTLVAAKTSIDNLSAKFAALNGGGTPVTLVGGTNTFATQTTLTETRDAVTALSGKFNAISNGGTPVSVVHPGSLATESTATAISNKLAVLDVNGRSPTTAFQGGTWTFSTGGLTNTELRASAVAVSQSGTWGFQGSVAHDSVDGNNPVKVGFKASSALNALTLVADGDRTDGMAGVDGVQVVRLNCALGDLVCGNASNTDGTSTQCIPAAGAGIKVYLTDITLTNSSASNIIVEIKDGSTVKWTFPVPAGGGVTHPFESPLMGTANTAWNFDGSAAATTLYCSMSGFKSKV